MSEYKSYLAIEDSISYFLKPETQHDSRKVETTISNMTVFTIHNHTGQSLSAPSFQDLLETVKNAVDSDLCHYKGTLVYNRKDSEIYSLIIQVKI